MANPNPDSQAYHPFTYELTDSGADCADFLPMQTRLCGECRKAEGWTPKDDGVHTAMLQTCMGCGVLKPILPERHWQK
ncbi:MAG: hypothetical protein GWN00_02355 [Aliifodinibius sp.]|nr:hypothetical protein [Phycisphaerae bacterium]NIT55116.1 hypothetical protein [Fodinibius sp.]NIY23700.1 hypothetical protein [Fodinibius sp.]